MSCVFLTTPTATFGSTRALEKSHGTDTSMSENSRNVEMTITSLRCLIGTSSSLGLEKSRVYLAATAAWEIFSAIPIGNELSPVLQAVPSLSSSQDETFSILTSSFAGAVNLSAWGNLIRYLTLFPSARVTERTICLPSSVANV